MTTETPMEETKKCECIQFKNLDVIDTSFCPIHKNPEITTPFTSDGNKF